MIELEEAQERILSLTCPLDCRQMPLGDSAGRFLAAAILADRDLPPFDNSAMDGYAVRAEDLASATAQTPVSLILVGRTEAGQAISNRVRSGQCVRVFTGSPLPEGANAVIMQEDTVSSASQPELMLMLCPVLPGENVRRQGEDVQRNTPVVGPGERLSAAKLGLLKALGCHEVQVGGAPVVALLATGNELREPPEQLGPGQIYESNRISLAALAQRAGALPRIYPLVPDEMSATTAALASALSECDAVVTTGGVSVGDMDLVKSAFESLGGKLEFWQVAIKPGKPFVHGQCLGKPFFGLPGNPVSAFVTFLLLVRPALLKMQGAAELQLPVRHGRLAEPLTNRGDRRHFVRVSMDGTGFVRASGPQASHRLLSLARANGLLDMPPASVFVKDQSVPVLSWD